VLHQIGIGTLGPVFRTYEPTRDRLVAVKVFRLDIVPEQAQSLADALTRATQASLRHPSIVEPIASGVEGTLAYRAEEYVAAESLDVAMRHYAPAPIGKALPFITQLAGAIDFARATGIGHGGLHPRDIFMTPDDARATGFGVVEALEQVGIRAPIRRPYTAPERIEGGAWGTPADVFSLAAITFELLTGRRPAGTGAQAGALPEGDRSEALHAVLARAMDDDPSRRYGSALAFAGALESAARGETVPGPLVPQSTVPESTVPASTVLASSASATGTSDSLRTTEGRATEGPRDPGTPGELEVEEPLDPVHAAPSDVAAGEGARAEADIVGEREADLAHATAPLLFDLVEAAERESRSEDVAGEAAADADVASYGGAGRFTDDFVDEDDDAELPPPVARDELTSFAAEEPAFAIDTGLAGHGEARPSYGEERMFTAGEPDLQDVPERSVVLPFAVGLVLGLLVGFGGGYFVGSRDRLAPVADTPPVATTQPVAPPAPTGPATPEKPGQYSEQKVTPPPPAPASREAPAAAPTRPERLARRGRLVVQSTPAHAAVTLNGTWRGRTPLTLDDLAFGKYVVRVVQPGFKVAQEDVTLSARDGAHTFNARLEAEGRGAALRPGSGQAPRSLAPSSRGAAPAPASFTGSLYVDSRPRGATVLLDGRSVGQTPLTLADVPIGAHVVRIELAGRKPWIASTRVTAGETARVTGSLEDKP
jgi:hypothetical protein